MRVQGPFLYGQAAPQPTTTVPLADAGLLDDDARNSALSLQRMWVPRDAQSAAASDAARPPSGSDVDTPTAAGAALVAEGPQPPRSTEVIGAPFVSSAVARGLEFPVNILQGPQQPPSDPDTGGHKGDADTFEDAEGEHM